MEVDDSYNQPRFEFTGKLDKLTISIERSLLTAEDEKRLIEGPAGRATIETTETEEREMKNRRNIMLGALTISILSCVGVAVAQYGGYQQPGQYPLLDKASNRVIEKYRNSSCEQLWQDRSQPKSEEQQP